MAYTGVIFLSLISSIFLIKFKFVKHNFSFSELYPIYIIIGMLTSWIDILSFPLITLGVPLIFTISFIDSTSYKEAIWRVLKLSIYWGLGYAGMWRNHQHQSVCGIHLRQFYSFFFLISQFLRKEILHFFF